MRAVAAFAVVLFCAFLLGFALPARSGVPVELVSHPMSRGAQITLADLFEGAVGPSGTVVVSPAAPVGQSAVLDAARVQIVAHQAGLDWTNTRGQRRVIVENGGAAEPEPAPTPVTRPLHASRASQTRYSVATTAQALIYTRNVPAGETVVADDLAWAEVPAAAHLSDPIADAESVAGKIARRPLRAGSPALSRDLVGAKVIHKDDIVAVTFRDDGMQLSLQGRALGDAAAGDPVQVMNPGSKKIVEAVATGPGRALVGPEADMARVSHYASVR